MAGTTTQTHLTSLLDRVLPPVEQEVMQVVKLDISVIEMFW